MRAETAAEQLFFTTVYITGTDPAGSNWTGTGFIVNYSIEGGNEVPVLVTNKHVLSGASVLVVRMVRAGADGQPDQAAVATTINDFNDAAWYGHPDPSVDVAVMFLGAIINQMAERGDAPFFRSFTPDLMLTEPQALELDALEQVTFVGYPNGLFDTASFLPIARRGQTATPIQNDYRGTPAFLIDASVFGGSSGSPVLIFDRGMYTTRGGGTTIGSRLHLLGVLAAVHIRKSTGEVLDLPAKRVAVFDEAIDLGVVFKARTIQECVDALFTRVGIVVAATALPPEPIE